MIGTIRKHSTVLWIGVIIVVVITFVYWGTPGQKAGREGGDDAMGSIEGVPVTRAEYNQALKEAKLRYFASYKEWPEQGQSRYGFDEERDTYYRLFFIHKLNELNIQVDSTAAAEVGRDILAGLDRGQPVPFETFLTQVLEPHNMTTEDFDRFLRHDLGIQQLITLVGLGSRLITPDELKAAYRQRNEEVATSVLFFSASNYLSKVKDPAPDELARFYANGTNMGSYTLPERMQVTYVTWDPSNYLAGADKLLESDTNTAAKIEEYYRLNGTNDFPNAKSPQEARQLIREKFRLEIAQFDAFNKAKDFASTLFDRNPIRPENLAELAREQGLTARTSQPFDEETGPEDLNGGPSMGAVAFALTPEEPFSRPLADVDRKHLYVIAAGKRFPSEVQPFSAVRDRVLADYRLYRAAQLAREAGSSFAQMATNGLAAGKPFEKICEEAAVNPEVLPPFSMSTAELPQVEKHTSFTQFRQGAFMIPPGQASPFAFTRDGGLVLYVKARLPIDESRMHAELPGFARRMRQEREQEALNEWLSKEVPKALQDTPLARRQQQQQQQGPPGPGR